MRKIGAWLKLMRVSALPTALADVWLGAAVVDGVRQIVGLSLISLALYAAGMILNDVHDVDEDRRTNPLRPLPLGQIPVWAAAAAGFGLLAAGVIGAAFLGRLTLTVALLLALLIVTYDFSLKATAFGPVNMGLCRAFNVFLGMSAVPGGDAVEFSSRLLTAAPVFVYVASVTLLSRGEADSTRRTPRLLPCLGIGLAGLLVLGTMLADLAIRFPALIEWPPAANQVTIGFVLLTLSMATALMWQVWRAKNLRRIVTIALVGIIPLEALVAVGNLRLVEAALIAALLVPLFVLRKLSHIT